MASWWIPTSVFFLSLDLLSDSFSPLSDKNGSVTGGQNELHSFDPLEKHSQNIFVGLVSKSLGPELLCSLLNSRIRNQTD